MRPDDRTPSAFRVPAFRRLWIAAFVSDAGDWLLFVALPLVVLRLTGSAVGTAFAFLLELVPAVALAPVAARVATRFDRRTVLVVVNLAQAATLLPLLLVDSADAIVVLYAVIAVHASLSALFEPAKNSLLPDLVHARDLVSANALLGLNQNLGRLVGGPIGGLLLAFGGLEIIVGVDAATFLVSAALIAAVRVPRVAAPEEGAATGVLAALRRRGLRPVLGMVLTASVAQGMFQVLFVLFVLGPLHGGDAEVGLLRGVQAVGAIAAGLALAVLARRVDAPALAVGSTVVFGGLSLTLWTLPALTTATPPYVVLFAAAGAPGVVMVTAFVSLLQRRTTPAERPAAFAAAGLVTAVGQGLGLLLGGLVDAGVPLMPLLVVQGSLYLLAGLHGGVALRRERGRLDRSAPG